MGIQCWPDLLANGAREHLQETYEGMLMGQGETEPEYDVSLKIDLEQIPSEPGECEIWLLWLHHSHSKSLLRSPTRFEDYPLLSLHEDGKIVY